MIGQLLAKRLRWAFLDTGTMYRAVTWAVLQAGMDPNHERDVINLVDQLKIRIEPSDEKTRLYMNKIEITEYLRETKIENVVSLIAKMPRVRSAMVKQQREIASSIRCSIVMVGRDIGTVVLPNASLKIYLTASVDIRAKRRYFELLKNKKFADLQIVTDELKERDKIDTERKHSPLRIAEDAIRIETDLISIEDVIRKIEHLVSEI